MFSFEDFAGPYWHHRDRDLDLDTEDKVCKYHFHGTCRDGDDCCYSHDPSKVAVCRFFSKGTCRHGNRCWFRHQRGEVEDQRDKFNVTLYKEKKQEKQKAFEKEMAVRAAKKKKEELVIYSASPYDHKPDTEEVTELDFSEAMRKMKEFRRLYFPLHMKKADLAWVDERIKIIQQGLDEEGNNKFDKRIFKFEMAGIHLLEDMKRKQNLGMEEAAKQNECAKLAEEIAKIAIQEPDVSNLQENAQESPRNENLEEAQINTPEVLPPKVPVNTPHDERWTAQTNILAYRFSLDDLFANHHIRNWSLDQVMEFYREAREGEFPWPELNTMLFNVYQPTPKTWAEFFLKFLPEEFDEDDGYCLSDLDEEYGLRLEDVTLSQLLASWVEESEVNELHIGGLLAGLMALNPEKYTLQYVVKIAHHIYDTGSSYFGSSDDKVRAFITIGFGKCTTFDTFCMFMHRLLKASPVDDDFGCYLDCECKSFECNCSGGGGAIDWEEAGKVLRVVAEYMCKSSEEKHEFFAKSTRRFWQPPVMALVYKDFIDREDTDPLKGCDPIPMSKAEMIADLRRNFSPKDRDYYYQVLKLNESTPEDPKEGEPRPDSQGSTIASSEFETASEDETSNNGEKRAVVGTEMHKVCLKKEDTDGKKNSKREKKKSVSFSDESFSTPSPDFDDQYSDYADEMVEHEGVKKSKARKENTQAKLNGREANKMDSTKTRSLPQSDKRVEARKDTTALKEVTNLTKGRTASQNKEEPAILNRKLGSHDYEALRKAAEETGKCQGKVGMGKGRPCQNCPKKDCIQGMCRRCCDQNGIRLCDPHDEPRNIFEAVERIVHPENHQDKWDDSMEYYTIVPSKHFNKQEEFESFMSGDYPTLRRISFGSDFGIKDPHVIKVAETFNKNLMVLELGCSDSGDGTWLTHKGVAAITQHCPNLIKLKLESCTSIGDHSVIDIWHKCPRLKHIQISGHDKSEGKVTKNALKPLFEDTNLVPQLIFLCLNDQSVGDDIVTRLRRARPNLAVVSGSTAEDIFDKMARLGFDELDDDDDYYDYMV